MRGWSRWNQITWVLVHNCPEVSGDGCMLPRSSGLEQRVVTETYFVILLVEGYRGMLIVDKIM